MWSFLSVQWLGVRVFIWLYFGLSIILGLGVGVYFYRERIRKKYYEIRFPEKLIKVCIHYPGSIFRIYWRLIPADTLFRIDDMSYSFDDKKLVKPGDFLGKPKGDEHDNDYTIVVNDRKYNIKKSLMIKTRWERYPEAHFFYNVPDQIEYDIDAGSIKFSAKELNDYQEKNLFTELLKLELGKPMIVLILMIVIGNLIGTMFLIAKYMELI